MVKVVNIKTYSFRDEIVVPIHRPYVLGNPFPLFNVNNIIDRDECLARYTRWFYNQIDEKNKILLKQLNFIKKLHKANQTVLLCCFCAPKKCHGDVIKEWVEQ